MSPASVCLDCCLLGYCKYALCIFLYYNDIIALSVSHLEMINVLLCIQVYASGSFLYRHDRQADIYTAMQLSFLNLTQTWRIRFILWGKKKTWGELIEHAGLTFICHCTYIYGGLGVFQDPIIQNKESLHLKTAKEMSLMLQITEDSKQSGTKTITNY